MAAGFGVPLSWKPSSYGEVKAPHRLSFPMAVRTMLDNLFTILLVPKSLWKLPIERLRQSALGHDEFRSYMRDLIDDAKGTEKNQAENLLIALVTHAGDSHGVLNDEEIMGNTFAFLMAGHETVYCQFIDAAHN